MDQLGHLPQRGELLARALDAVPEQLRPEPRSDRVQVGARVARAGGERAREALAELVAALDGRREQGLGPRPAADGQLEPFARSAGAGTEAIRSPAAEVGEQGE